jgi:endonuclease/exonuclease/phosphatase family metal-dependent hydrolase
LNLEDEIRVKNFEEVLKVCNADSEQDDAQILTGDFNQEDVDLNQYPEATKGEPWKDAWIEFCKLHPSDKVCDGKGLTFSTNLKYRKRIDFVMYRGKKIKHVNKFEILGGDCTSNRWNLCPSDHMAIFTEFELAT